MEEVAKKTTKKPRARREHKEKIAMVQPTVLRTKDAATYLNISVATLYVYAKEGKIPRVKFSEKCCGYRIEDLDKFVKSRLTTGR